jgi:hypothetical protein
LHFKVYISNLHKAMAAIGQGVVVEAPFVVLEVVAAEQVLDAVDVAQVVPVPVVHAPFCEAIKKKLSPLFWFFNLHYKNIKIIRNSKSLLQQLV